MRGKNAKRADNENCAAAAFGRRFSTFEDSRSEDGRQTRPVSKYTYGGGGASMRAPSSRPRKRPLLHARTALALSAVCHRVLAVFTAVVLCVSLGIPSSAVTDAGLSLGASHQAAFAAEGDGGATGGGEGDTTDPPVDPPVEPTYVNVPYVMGAAVPTARSQIEALGLSVAVNGPETSTSVVTSQDPAASTSVVPGSTVTLTSEERQAETPTLTDLIVGYYDAEADSPVWYPDVAQGQVPTVKQKGGKIQLLASVTWSTGKTEPAASQSVPLLWTSGDTSIATVDPTGMLTALADGIVTITCTSQKYGEVVGRIDVKIVGQDGAYVTEVAVTKADGTPYRDERVMFKETLDGTEGADLYATVYYSDGTERHTWEGDRIDNLVWSVTDSEICYINPDTGRIKPKDDGSVRAVATVSGGMDGGVSGYVYVVIDTGRYNAENWPSNSLEVEITYEEDIANGIDTPAKTKVYDVGSFAALGTAQAAYTVVTNNGHYATLSAEGVPLSRFLADLELVAGEVSYFQFFANDNKGGGGGSKISADYLFNRPSYYFPNMDIGVENGRIAAEPMLALRDSWRPDTPEKDFGGMGEGRRFRLVLGSSSLTDSAGEKTVKFINTVKIVMQGAAPIREENPGNETTNPAGPSSEGTGIVGTGPGSDTGSSDASGTQTVLGLSNQAETNADSSQGADSGAGGGDGSGKRWQVFEMMSKAESNIDPVDFNNPFEPFLLPGVLAVMTVGGFMSRTRLRREMAV